MKSSKAKIFTKEDIRKIMDDLNKDSADISNIVAVKEVSLVLSSPQEKEKKLRKILENEEMKKLANSSVCEDRLAHIKSKGNGL